MQAPEHTFTLRVTSIDELLVYKGYSSHGDGRIDLVLFDSGRMALNLYSCRWVGRSAGFQR